MSAPLTFRTPFALRRVVWRNWTGALDVSEPMKEWDAAREVHNLARQGFPAWHVRPDVVKEYLL